MIPMFGRGGLTGFVDITATGAITAASVTATGEVKADTLWATKTPGAGVVQVKLGDGDSGIGETSDDVMQAWCAASSKMEIQAGGNTSNVPLYGGYATLTSGLIQTPAAAQSITGVGVAFTVSSSIVEFTSTGNYTLTVTPMIANGIDGQEITLVNVGANTVTISDQGTVAGSNLRLTGATVAIGPRDSVKLYYSTDVGDWVQDGALVAVV